MILTKLSGLLGIPGSIQDSGLSLFARYILVNYRLLRDNVLPIS